MAMNKDLEIHPVQARVLRELLFKTEARFVELNVLDLTTDHFSFHIRSLVESGLVEKNANDRYSLTSVGKEFANRFDAEQKDIRPEKQAKLGVLVCCVKKEGKTKKYLVQQRLKQPYFGFYGFITGKIKWGETIYETAAREMQEESGLTGRLTLVGIKHKMDYSQEGDLLEDKHFFVFKVEEVKGNLIESYEGGRNLWLPKKDISKLPSLFDGVEETIKMILQKRLLFSETKYKVKGY